MKGNLELPGNDTDSSDAESEYLSDSNDDIAITEKLLKHKCRRRKIQPPTSTGRCVGDAFSLPQEDFDNLSPYDIFSQFWSNEITEQTNLFSVTKKRKSVNTNVSEIEQFLGIHMMMGIFRLPAYSNYWAVETRVNVIADTLLKKRYDDLRG